MSVRYPQKSQKISLSEEYPCPCRRKGKLVPIVLTEALGCDRCQQIFVVQPHGKAIEQVASPYPYKRSWRWTGHRWINNQNNWPSSYSIMLIGLTFVGVVIVLPLLQQAGLSHLVWAVLTIILAILPALVVWLSLRR